HKRRPMTERAPLDDYGELTAPATLTIQRLLPGPIERVWAHLTESDLRRTWLAAGAKAVQGGAPGAPGWRNGDLTYATNHRSAGRRRVARAAEPGQSTRAAPQALLRLGRQRRRDLRAGAAGRRGAAHSDPSPLARPSNAAGGQRRLAHAPRRAGRPRHRHGAGALLGRLEPPAAGLRPAATG